MRGGKKKDSPAPAPAPAGDSAGDEEAAEEEEQEEDEGEEAEAAAEAAPAPVEEESPPKLAEGFYEIEAIRKRRLRRGQLQYLVKWRGWPENANTWEPYENLKACSDIVDAFEQRSWSPRSSRKRNRKSTAPATGPSPSPAKRGRPPRSDNRSLPRPAAPHTAEGDPGKSASRTSSRRRTSNNSNKTLAVEHEPAMNVPGQEMWGEGTKKEGGSNVPPPGFPCQGAAISVSLTGRQDEDGLMDGSSKVESVVQASLSQGGQVTGAKKRKSGCVRRFKQDTPAHEQGEGQNAKSERPGNEDVDSTEGETADKNKMEDCGNRLSITKIIKPVRYFASITNDVQQVSITFKALRSDGQEVLVDDKELKANNPLVLISFYEQHLRYNPSS